MKTLTEKEMAKKLVTRYLSLDISFVYKDLEGDAAIGSEHMIFISAQECARTAADTMMTTLPMWVNYFKQVKEEIYKLDPYTFKYK